MPPSLLPSKPDFKIPTSKFKDGTSNPNFNVQCSFPLSPSPPSPPTLLPHCLFLQFFPSLFFSFFLNFCPRQTSKPDFKVPTSKMELPTQNSMFNVLLSPLSSLLPSPPTLLPHCLFPHFSLPFFPTTPNFEARLQSSNFEVRRLKMELPTQTSMFNVPPLLSSHPFPPSPPTLLPSCLFLHVFSLLLSFFFFVFDFSFTPNVEARLQSSNFVVRRWNFEVWVQKFHLRTSKFTDRTQTSIFNVPSLSSPHRHHQPPSCHTVCFYIFLLFFFFFYHANFEARLQSSIFEVLED